VAVVWAADGGRLLAHAIVPGEGTAGVVPLHIAPPRSGAVVHAVTIGPEGVDRAEAPLPALAEAPDDADPVLAAFLADLRAAAAAEEVPFPAWIRSGDSVAGDGPRPPVRALDVAPEHRTLHLRRGHEGLIPFLPPGTTVEWSVLPRGAAGAFRVRRGATVALEARAGPTVQGGTRAGAELEGESLWFEGEPGIEGLVLAWTTPRDPSAISLGKGGAGDPASSLTLARSLPERGSVGDRIEMRLRIRSTAAARVEVDCPVPRGAVPAEDGWRIAGSGPPGTRCIVVEEDRVVLRVTLEAGREEEMVVPLRLLRAGRFVVPEATVTVLGAAARTGAGVLVIE
jgi:hypothetical protein